MKAPKETPVFGTNSTDLAALKKARAAKKYWEAQEKALKNQLLQATFERARDRLRVQGLEHGTVRFDTEDGFQVKVALAKERKVNADDMARVIARRPDIGRLVQATTVYKLPSEADLKKMDPEIRALILECTTTTDKPPTIELIGGADEDEEEGDD